MVNWMGMDYLVESNVRLLRQGREETFYYNPLDGRMLSGGLFTGRVARGDFIFGAESKIIGFTFSGGTTDEARKVLEETIYAYNES